MHLKTHKIVTDGRNGMNVGFCIMRGSPCAALHARLSMHGSPFASLVRQHSPHQTQRDSSLDRPRSAVVPDINARIVYLLAVYVLYVGWRRSRKDSSSSFRSRPGFKTKRLIKTIFSRM